MQRREFLRSTLAGATALVPGLVPKTLVFPAVRPLGNVSDIALRLGRKLKWLPSENRFDGDEQANQMLTRTERSPWRM